MASSKVVGRVPRHHATRESVAVRIEFEIRQRDEIDDSVRTTFAEMLRKQGKVQGDLAAKADRCKLICIARLDGKVIAIGGIKQKTASDFSSNKAGVPDLSKGFEWELGYLYTDRDYSGRGVGSHVGRVLVEAYG